MASPGLSRVPRPRPANSPPLAVMWEEKSRQLLALDPTAGSAVSAMRTYENLDRLEDRIAAVTQQGVAATPAISPLLDKAIDEHISLEGRYARAATELRALQRTLGSAASSDVHIIL